MSHIDDWIEQLPLHRMYLRDDVRNRAFATAIARHVTPGSRVLDLGSGTGIWACVAAKAGAGKVVAVEFSDLAEHARRTAERNGVADVVEVIRADIRELALEREFDVVIHELIGGLVWEEDMIELTALARERWLRPGGVLFPGEVTVWMSPWRIANDRPRRAEWTNTCGLDFTHMYEADLAQWRATRRPTSLHGLTGDGQLAAPVLVETVRLGLGGDPVPRELVFEVTAERDAIATGVLAFMTIDIGGEVIRTGPEDPPTNWGQLYIPADEPFKLEAGGRYELRVVPNLVPSGWEVGCRAIVAVRHFPQ
jgi:protein arginine N-methyltransferase 1